MQNKYKVTMPQFDDESVLDDPITFAKEMTKWMNKMDRKGWSFVGTTGPMFIFERELIIH